MLDGVWVLPECWVLPRVAPWRTWLECGAGADEAAGSLGAASGAVGGAGLSLLRRCGLPAPRAAVLRAKGLAALAPGVAWESGRVRAVTETRAGLWLDLSRLSARAREVLESREVFPLDLPGSSIVPEAGLLVALTPVVLCT